ncbi:unnamed protein product [Arctogadus glacialis]
MEAKDRSRGDKVHPLNRTAPLKYQQEPESRHLPEPSTSCEGMGGQEVVSQHRGVEDDEDNMEDLQLSGDSCWENTGQQPLLLIG